MEFIKIRVGLFKSQFFQNVSIVVGGTTIAQAITLLCSPIITRLFSPEAFGALGVMTSLVTTMLPVATLSYPYAIVLPRSNEDSFIIVKTSIAIGGIVSASTLFLVLIFREETANLLNLSSYSNYLLLIPVTLFFHVITTTYDQWLFRQKLFKASSIILVGQSIISNGGSIAAGLMFLGDAFLFIIYSIAHGFHAIASLWVSRKNDRQSSNLGTNQVGIFDHKSTGVLREYSDFPRYRTPQILANSLSRNLPVLLLTIIFGPIPAGFYTLSQRVLSLPSIIISDSFGKVLFPKLTDYSHHEKSLQPLLIKSTLGLVAFGLIPFGLLVGFSPPLFSFVFGNNWYEAGEMARWMAISLFFMFINVPSIKAIPLLGLQKLFLVYEIIAIFFRIGGFLMGVFVWHEYILAIVIYSFFSALFDVILITYVIRCSNKRSRFIP